MYTEVLQKHVSLDHFIAVKQVPVVAKSIFYEDKMFCNHILFCYNVVSSYRKKNWNWDSIVHKSYFTLKDAQLHLIQQEGPKEAGGKITEGRSKFLMWIFRKFLKKDFKLINNQGFKKILDFLVKKIKKLLLKIWLECNLTLRKYYLTIIMAYLYFNKSYCRF